MIRHVTGVSVTVLILVASLYHPGIATAHGSADMEQDPCMRLAGESMVHFSAYQPQYEIKDQYCTEIPQEGDTFLVVDLVDPTLRNEPVGMRVVKGNGKNETEDKIVADLRPSTHPDGVLRSEVRLDEGLYTITIESEKQSPYAAPAVSLTGAHDRLSEAGAAHRRTADRPAVRWLARLQAHPIELGAEMVGGPQFVESQGSSSLTMGNAQQHFGPYHLVGGQSSGR